MRYFTIKKKTQHSFKKRYPFIKKLEETYQYKQYSRIISSKPITFEFIYWRRLKKLIKRVIKRKVRARRKIRYKFYKKNAWVFLKPNFPISRKSKNSRMGKGIGSFIRWSTRLYSNHTFLKFKRIQKIKIIKLSKSLFFTFKTPFYYK